MKKRNIIVDYFNTRRMNVSLTKEINCYTLKLFLIIFT